METPETVNLTEFHPRYSDKERKLLVNALDGCMSQKSNLKSLTRKTYNNSLIQQANWLEMVLHAEQNQACSTVEVCWKYLCILALVLIYEVKMDQNYICN